MMSARAASAILSTALRNCLFGKCYSVGRTGKPSTATCLPRRKAYLESIRLRLEKILDHCSPTLETHLTVFNGIVYTDLPIINVKCSQNNTIIALTNPKTSKILAMSSCGVEGFRNCKKGTNVAGQAVGLSMGRKAITMGHGTVRVVVKGLGPGRASSIKGLEMAGLNMISITDDTFIAENGNRPRKARRI